MKNSLLIASIVLMGFFSCNSKTDSTESGALIPLEESTVITTVTSQQVRDLLEKGKEIVLLDVRTPEEFAEGHLVGARNINFQAADFSQQLKSLNPDQKYLVYCAIGGRSGKSVKLMEEMGFKHVYDASEGFSKLSNSGLPVAEGKAE